MSDASDSDPSPDSDTRYGYIGTAMLGSAMTERLLSTGASVTVFDIEEAAVATAVGHGAVARWVSTQLRSDDSRRRV